MDPSDPNYYPYGPSHSQAPYGVSNTSSAPMDSLSGFASAPYTQQSFYPAHTVPYEGPNEPYGQPMPGAQTNFNPASTTAMAPEGSSDIPPDFVLESEEQKRQDKRREQNRLAQRKFRVNNKKKIEDLQEKLADLKKETERLKGSNEALRAQQELLETQIQELSQENERIRGSLGSSPVSPSDSWAQYGAAEDLSDPYIKRGSTSSYSGSHRSH